MGDDEYVSTYTYRLPSYAILLSATISFLNEYLAIDKIGQVPTLHFWKWFPT